MASTLGSVTAISSLSSIAMISIKKPSLFTEYHHQHLHSFPSNRLSIIRTPSFLSLAPLSSTKWSMPAAAAEDASVMDDSIAPEPEPVPEPVEAQIEAAAGTATGKAEVFAVVMVGSRQYIVFPGRFIYTQRLKGANVNDKVILSKVLLVGTKTKAYIGQPVVTNAAVHAVVEEQGLDKKVVVFKYKKKKNYRRNIGHRQPNTRIRITGITGYEDFPADTMPEAVPA